MSEKLNQAIALIKAGNKRAALPVLKEVIRANSRNEHAWLWLSSCVDEVERKTFCLQKALEINPDNLHAHNALRKLTELPSQPVGQAAPAKAVERQPVSKRKSNTNPNRHYWFFAVGMGVFLFLCATVSALYLAGTGRLSAFAAGLPLFPSSTLTPSLTPTVTATITPSPVPTVTETATPLPSPILTPSAMLGTAGIAPLEALESYRMQGKMAMGGELDSASFAWTFTQEWVKGSSAQRIIMSMQTMALDSGSVPSDQFPAMTLETIVIDQTAWMKLENDWIRIDSQQLLHQQNGVPSPISDWHSLTFVGDEIINGVPCIHYTVDEDIIKISGSDNDQDMTMHALGDIWAANRPDLPSVILRMKIQMRMSGFFSFQTMATSDPLMETVPQELKDEEMVYSYEYDVTDVNTAIIIEPPSTSTEP